MSELPPSSFDQQLIAAQKVDETLRERYEKEVKTMFEQTLSTPKKVAFSIQSVGSIAMIGFFTYMATKPIPPLARVGFLVGIVFAAGWLIVLMRMVLRGKMNLKKDSNAMAGMTWGFTVILVTLFMLQGGQHPERINSVFMVLTGVVFLIGAAVFMLQQGIQNARMKVEERMLELQYQLAELADELKKRK